MEAGGNWGARTIPGGYSAQCYREADAFPDIHHAGGFGQYGVTTIADVISVPEWEAVHASRSGTNSFPTCRRTNSGLESRREAHNMSDPRARYR